jgi:HK97 family phage prohead protease
MTKTLSDTNWFVSEVEDHEDRVAFQFDFELGEGKALSDSIVEETEDGDLIIEGYAAVFEGVDREGENFAPGAFQRGCKAFLEHSAPLCYHHRKADVLGKVLDLQEDGKGLKMRARIDGAIRKHPTLGVIYEQVKRGTFNGLSVQGFFKRALQEGGPKIVDMDFTEISITPTGVHTGPRFAVVAGKALSDIEFPATPEQKEDIRMGVMEFEEQVRAAVAQLDGIVSQIAKIALGQDDEGDTDDESTDEKPADDTPVADTAPAGAEAVTA